MIGVIGAGSWGTALAIVLAKNSNLQSVPLWARDSAQLDAMQKHQQNERYLPNILLPKKISYYAEVVDLLAMVQDIMIAVPSCAFVELIKNIKPYLSTEHRVLWVTKGMEPTSGRFFHELVQAELGAKRACAILSGPSFAYEVAIGLPTAVTVAATDDHFAKDIVAYFHTDCFRVYTSSDILGVQLGGVVKNILAVATGISDGLNYGANARAALITRGLAEMQRLGNALGAQPKTLMGLAGLGDVVLSCTDNQSRNRRFGLALAAGQTKEQAQKDIGQVVEAVHNSAEICRLASRLKVAVPITEQINLILNNKITPADATRNLINRLPTEE